MARALRATGDHRERRLTATGADARQAEPAAVRLALAHLERHGRVALPLWSDADVTSVRTSAPGEEHRQIGEAEAVAALGAAGLKLAAGIALVPLLAPGGPFGPAWSGHGFASDGFRDRTPLREPDLTRELARLLGPTAGRRGAERARSFLRILCDLAGADALAAVLSEQTRPMVTAEHPVRAARGSSRASEPIGIGGRRRLDLLFEWPLGQDKRQAVIAVEVKLGAAVAEGQLRPYGEAARRRAGGGPVTLVLLTAAPDGAERRNRAWRPVRWFALLRRWEAALAATDDADPAFARLRARLWRALLTNPGAL